MHFGVETMSLTVEQLDHFHREGYVVARDVFVPDEYLQPVTDEYAEVLDRMARRMHAAGEIQSTYAELPFEQRAIAIVRDAGALDQRAIDGLVNGVGIAVRRLGARLRPLQSGFVRAYGSLLAAGALLVVGWIVARGI